MPKDPDRSQQNPIVSQRWYAHAVSLDLASPKLKVSSLGSVVRAQTPPDRIS
jgi:hypothetical protein